MRFLYFGFVMNTSVGLDPYHFVISDILAKTKENWRGLADKTTGKGPSSKSHLLEQAVAQKTLNVNLKELHDWLDMAEMR